LRIKDSPAGPAENCPKPIIGIIISIYVMLKLNAFLPVMQLLKIYFQVLTTIFFSQI